MRRFLPVPACKWMGEGPLLLFLHGIGGNKDVFDQQLPAFADGWRTAAWDMPGYGESELQGEMTFELLADSVAQLLDDLGEHDVDLVGHSMGGSFVNSLACARGDVLRAVAVVGGGYGGVPGCRGQVAALVMHNPDDRLVPVPAGQLCG